MELKYYSTMPQILEGVEAGDLGFIHIADLNALQGGEALPRKIPARRFLVTITVQEDDSSYRYRALMDKTQLVLKFSLPYYIDLPVGTWCDYMGQRFYLGIPANFKKQGTRKFEYTLNMGTLENGMADYKLHNSVDGRLKWSMCAKPHEFIEEIVRNLNERDGEGVWSVGDCLDSTEKTIEFNHSYIDAALQSIADTFETEWEIAPGNAEDTFIINLHKVEHFKDDPLALSYGRGNGFVPGVGRTSKSDEKPIKRLYTEGTDRNIDRSKYGEAELRLPRSKSLTYDGTHFEGDKVDGVVVALNPATSRTYETDPAGTYIERTDMTSQAVKEDSLDCSEIYPSRVGKVSDWVCVNADKNFYDLVDNSIPDDLDFDQYQIAGETMTIIFQSGMLAGKEFDVSKYSHRPKTVNGVQKQGKRFEIVPQEYDGVLMPNDTFKPKMGADGDTYAVFGIQLPEAYICNDATKEGASWEMFKEAVKFLYEHEEQKFTFAGELQGIWAKRNWLRVGSHLKVGGYVLFRDNQFAKDGTLIRITGIKDFLTSPYSPTIEISNSVGAASTASQQLREIEATEVVISDTKRSVLEFTKRRFRDAKETMSMLQSALQSLSDEYTDAVSPIAVKTMQVLLGDESLQFQFVRGLDNLTRIDDTFGYDQANKVFGTAGVSYIQHLTLGINNISSQHEAAEFKKWMLPKYESPALGDGSKSYYVYAVCKQEAQTGYFTLSETPLILQGMDADHDDCYNLLCGVLNSEYDGERSFVPLYGFTEILPGRITTDKIVSGNGESYFDMVHNAFKLGEHLQFNVDGSNELRLKGTIIQSPSGEEFYAPCFRGAYSASVTYYPGDTVTYTVGGATSTYMCIAQTTNHNPTDGNYWRLIASHGSNGTNGTNGADGKEILDITQYWMCTAAYVRPASTNSGWLQTIPPLTDERPYLWVKTVYTYTDNSTDITITLSAVKGAKGQKGDTGASPAMVFRGDYDPTATYYGYSKRLDCVRYEGAYYIAVLNETRGSDGFAGHDPSDTDYWANFGASFESVATNLLLAEMANIGGWIMKDNRLISQIGTIEGEISNDYADPGFTPAIILDAINGEIWQGDNILINGDGISLFDDAGNIAAKFVNQSIGNEADLSEMSATKNIHHNLSARLYNPYGGSTQTTTIGDTIDLGYFARGSSITINSASMSFITPENESGGTIYYPQISFKIEILRGWTVVRTINMPGGGGGYAGTNVSGSMTSAVAIAIDGTNYAAGQYRIRISSIVVHNCNTAGVANVRNISVSCNYAFVKSGMQKTLIGSDGMYSCWGNKQYFFTSADGIIMRHGDNILKISGSGIQKSTNGGTSFTNL